MKYKICSISQRPKFHTKLYDINAEKYRYIVILGLVGLGFIHKNFITKLEVEVIGKLCQCLRCGNFNVVEA